ncbi:uncharacterized protein FTOL_13006 [Fusarium torulosum]|uniref:Uncharacterized protein n=1 Tax=Fusarium torulosum TaxID=33205 RepID=A0AAE8SPF3_9HYPO|nr:uncharacterized protein FTOL_13006 [Fusarium torulosum]
MSHAYQIADHEARDFTRSILYGKDAIHSLKSFVDRAALAMVISLCKNHEDLRTTCHHAAVPSWSEPKPS